jgi:hypothetical protein
MDLLINKKQHQLTMVFELNSLSITLKPGFWIKKQAYCIPT